MFCAPTDSHMFPFCSGIRETGRRITGGCPAARIAPSALYPTLPDARSRKSETRHTASPRGAADRHRRRSS